MSFLATAGAFLLKHAPTILSTASHLFGGRKPATASRVLQRGADLLFNKGAQYIQNKVGDDESYNLLKETAAPSVKAFRSQLNRAGAFID